MDIRLYKISFIQSLSSLIHLKQLKTSKVYEIYNSKLLCGALNKQETLILKAKF